MDKKTVYFRQFVIEWIEHNNAWRVFREEKPSETLAYIDDPAEAKERLADELDEYDASSDGYEVEVCAHCSNEVAIRWNINELGFQAFCPICGNRLMLCDACSHRHEDLNGCGDCDYWTEKDCCRFSRPDNWWKEEAE